MKRKISSLLVLLLLLSISVERAQSQTTDDALLFKVPSEYALTFVSIQTGAPIQFQSIEVLAKRRGDTPFLGWTLKNNSSRAVRRYEVAFIIRHNVEGWKVLGGQTVYDFGTNGGNDLILPYSTATESTFSKNPLPSEIRQMFEEKSTGEKRLVIVYGRINKVVFSDGTVYEDRSESFGDI